MKISLIELNAFDVSAIGMRMLSACLKRVGHHVQLIFLANAGYKNESNIFVFPDHVIDQVVNLCRNSDLIGISFLTSGFHRAVQLTEILKSKLGIPVIWGGIHATVEPEQCLNHADGVCRGEGEEALLEFVQRLAAGQDYYDTLNFWFKKDGKIIKNPLRPLIQNLDELPFLDYDLAGEHFAFVKEKEEICQLDKSLLLDFITPKRRRADMGKTPFYVSMASRGCPMGCSYCFHKLYRAMYPGQRYIRRRSAANVIQELENFIKLYDFQGLIWFADDDFTAATTKEMQEFSELYKEKIGFPFLCFGSPVSISEKKLQYLTDGGLRFFEFGIQTGSTKTKKLFNRSFSSEKIINCCKIINKFSDKIRLPYYDFILDNPGETVEDELETLDLILEIPRPYQLALASFRYFPGSVLYEEAKKEGLISLEGPKIYGGELHTHKGTLGTFLIVLYGFFNVPKGLIKFLRKPKIVHLLNRKALSFFFKIPYTIHRIKQQLFY